MQRRTRYWIVRGVRRSPLLNRSLLGDRVRAGASRSLMNIRSNRHCAAPKKARTDLARLMPASPLTTASADNNTWSGCSRAQLSVPTRDPWNYRLVYIQPAAGRALTPASVTRWWHVCSRVRRLTNATSVAAAAKPICIVFSPLMRQHRTTSATEICSRLIPTTLGFACRRGLTRSLLRDGDVLSFLVPTYVMMYNCTGF